MKNIFYAFFLLLVMVLFAEAEVEKKEINTVISATRGDIKIIEASENIRYLSQKIAKDYLFFYQYPQKVEVKKELHAILDELGNDLRIIATTTKDTDTKDILEFLAYSKDQIEEIFNEKSDAEKAALMLDYSETLLEGADSIANTHRYDFSDEEKMLMITKEMEYLLERVAKYYMVMHVGFKSDINKEQMQEAMMQLERNIEKINHYVYPDELLDIQEKLNVSWKANKYFFNKSETLFIPKLMFASVEYMEDAVIQIALHHSKN